MNDDIIRMAREAGFAVGLGSGVLHKLHDFAALVAAAKEAEHKEAMRWDVHSCGPTCKRYACVATREAVAAEREACARICDTTPPQPFRPSIEAAHAIRARGCSSLCHPAEPCMLTESGQCDAGGRA